MMTLLAAMPVMSVIDDIEGGTPSFPASSVVYGPAEHGQAQSNNTSPLCVRVRMVMTMTIGNANNADSIDSRGSGVGRPTRVGKP